MPSFKLIQHMRHFAMAILLCFISSCSSKKKELNIKQAELYFGAGTQSLMDRQYTEALKNLMKANELTPNNSEIINNLGMAYYFKGEKELAIKTLKKALELKEDNSDAKINLASIYYKSGDMNEAEKIYKQVLRDLTYDKQARTLYNLGLLELYGRKNSVTAENYFKKSVKEDDNYCPSYYYLGIIRYQRRQYSSALRYLKEASIGTCYEAPAPHYFQALTMIELRRFVEARMKLDEIDTRFKKSVYARKARLKTIEINEIEKRKSSESHASRDVLESPDF